MDALTTIEVGVAIMFVVKMARAYVRLIPGVELALDGDRVLALVFASALAWTVLEAAGADWQAAELTPDNLRAAVAVSLTAIGGNVMLGRVERRIE